MVLKKIKLVKEGTIFKIDVEKAYDHVGWGILDMH